MTRPIDNGSEKPAAPRFPCIYKGIAVAVAAALLLIIGWGLYPFYTELTSSPADVALESTAARLLRLDEILTVSAAMSAATGEQYWLQRYREYKIERERTLYNFTKDLDEGGQTDPQYADLKQADKAVQRMERKAFALVNAGKRSAALRLLTGEEYRRQRSVYSERLYGIHRRLAAALEARRQAETRLFHIALVAFLAFSAISVSAWVVASRSARRWKHTLVQERKRERKVVGKAVENGLRSASLHSMTSAGQTAIDGLAMVDLNLAYDYVNPALCRLHKCQTPEEMIGRNVGEFLAQETLARLRELTQKALSGESVESFEGLARANGQLVPIEVAPSLVASDTGAPWAFLLIIRDVTEQKRAQEELRKSRDFYLSLFEDFPNPVWRSDRDGKFDYFNKTWLSFTGRTLPREIENGWTEGIHPEDLERCVNTYSEAFHARQPFNMEFRLLRHDGQYRWMIDCGRPFSDPDGRFAGFIGACYDITERQQMEDQLGAKNRELESFVYTVSHDLRAPLVSMAGFARLLSEEYADRIEAEGQQYLRRIHANIDSMNALLTELLELSRIGRLEEHKEEFSVGEAVRKTLEDHTGMIEQSGARIKVAEEWPVVRASRARLSQIFSNLISNAIKFSRKGVIPELEIGWEPAAAGYRFFVRDNGIGIKESHLQGVFEIFSRLKEKEVEGTGIGLAIVKRVVEDHGGQVGVNSAPGEGSTFWFTLPASQEQKEEEEEWALATSRL